MRKHILSSILLCLALLMLLLFLIFRTFEAPESSLIQLIGMDTFPRDTTSSIFLIGFLVCMVLALIIKILANIETLAEFDG